MLIPNSSTRDYITATITSLSTLISVDRGKFLARESRYYKYP